MWCRSLIAAAISSLCLLFPLHADDASALRGEWGTVSGMLRFFYVFDGSYVKSGRTTDYDIDGSAIGGHFKYTSPQRYHIGASAALYFAADTGLNDFNDPDTIGAAGRFFTRDYATKGVCGELNLFYENGGHRLLLGRQKIDSPLTNAIYTYMPDMFEALLYQNTQISNTEVIVLQIDKMAYGTRAPVEFGLIGETTRTAGATQNALDIRGKFRSIESQTLADETVSTHGVSGIGFINRSLAQTTLRVWDFYAYDIINMLYADAQYRQQPYIFSLQYLEVRSVGDDLASAWLDDGRAYLYGVKVGFKEGRISAYASYNHSGSAKLINPWGGDPAYTSSFFSRNAYRADVDAYKLGVNVMLKEGLHLIASYADYGRSDTEGTFSPATPVEPAALPSGDAMESALLLSYNPVKSVNILTGAIYKKSEYSYAGKQVRLLDLDFVATYRF
jgi:hypothetical protein